MSLISGKHKMVIMYCLMEYQTVRFNELKRYLKKISDKTLSSNLKELEADQLIIRKEYPQIPPKVEYMLSERGQVLDGTFLTSSAFGVKKTGFDFIYRASVMAAGAFLLLFFRKDDDGYGIFQQFIPIS